MFCWARTDCRSVLSALMDDKSFTVSNPPSAWSLQSELWPVGRQARPREGGGRSLCLILLLPYIGRYRYVHRDNYKYFIILLETALWKTWWLVMRKEMSSSLRRVGIFRQEGFQSRRGSSAPWAIPQGPGAGLHAHSCSCASPTLYSLLGLLQAVM